MANAKSTKKSLLFSALSLMLCFAMLIGTTFAWFTDSVTSANNVIKSGNLDIELEYWNGEKWVDVKGKSDILTNTLWEPGVTEVAYLKVKNAGSLALKYRFGVNIASETEGVNAAGESFKLSDYILFSVVEGVNGETDAYATREDAVADATGAKKISTGYTKASSMLAGDEFYLALVVYMPTEVGNEANHNGTNVPKIELGINIMATQHSYEEDSFDEYYDGAAPWHGGVDTSWYNTTDTEFVIGTAEQLAGLAELVNTGVDSFAGKTIKLASNIDLNNLNWTPVGTIEYNRDAQTYGTLVAFKGTFDGQGHTINNLMVYAPETEGAGLFACAESATFKNLTMNNVDIVAGSHAGSIVGGRATHSKLVTFTNCHVVGDLSIVVDWSYAGGIVGKASKLEMSDCSVVPNGVGVITAENRNAVGSLIGWIETASTITNCSAINMNLTGWANIGSLTGFLSEGTTMSDCSAENITLTKTRALGHPTVGILAGGFSYSASKAITLTNNTAKNITLNGPHITAPASANTLYGAEFSGKATSNFVLDNNVTENITNNLVEVTSATPATLQGMIDNAAPGTAIALGAGTYTETIVMKSGITLVGDKSATVYCINLNGANDVTLRGIVFDAAGAKRGYDYNGGAKFFANIITGDLSNNLKKGAHNIVIDGCTFTGTFANGGTAISFTDYKRTSGFSGNITIKNCTFDTKNSYYDIYGFYLGDGNNGHGDFVIENNTFKSVRTQGLPIYLGRYASSTPVVIKNNAFKSTDSLGNSAFVQDHSSYGVSVDASGNTFAG